MLEYLVEQPNIAMPWFESNYIKMNSDKCNLLILDNKSD